MSSDHPSVRVAGARGCAAPARAAIVAFWLVMTGWLVRFEAFPHWFSETAPGYRALFGGGPVIQDAWMRIEFQGAPIGYSHTWVDSEVDSPQGGATLHNQTQLTLNLLGREQSLLAVVSAGLDADYRLQRFRAVVLAAGSETRVEGQRQAGTTFAVAIRAGRGAQTLRLEIPDDVQIYSPATELALAGLQPGQSLALRVLDPVTLAISDLRVEALRREPLRQDGRVTPATVVRAQYHGMEFLSWVDAAGRVLRQETPFGWTLVAASADDVLAARGRAAPAPAADLAESLAVPLEGGAGGDLRTARVLDVRLRDAVVQTQALASARQIVVPEAGPGVRLRLYAQPAPAAVGRVGTGAVPAALRADLAATAALPADHPAIRRQAAEIAGGETNAWAAARTLYDWVYRNLEKRATASLPSALEVLDRRAGDCNEHTYLYVALARALGLPARILVGLVYAELPGRPGAFYYHAWPAVYVGEWVELDPTLGQPLADATHLAVARGEAADQLAVLGLMGRARLELLECHD